MGGYRRGSELTPNQRRWYERRAKEDLEQADGGKTHNVFISFSSDDLDDVNMLRGQAKNENSNIEFNDWSLKAPFNSENSEYIKRGIRQRIRQSSVTVVYLSDSTAESEWVDWEIRESIVMGKGVVAMHKGDSSPTRLPKAITEHNIKVVPWNQQQLAQAIKKESEDR